MIELLYLITAAVFLFAIYVESIRFENIFIEPIYLLAISIVFAHFLVPCLQYYVGYYRYQASYSDATHIKSIVFSSLFLGSLLLIYRVLPRQVVLGHRLDNNQSVRFNNDVLIFIVFIVLLVIPAVIFSAKNFTEIMNMGIGDYMKNRISHGTGNGFTILLAQFLPFFCAFSFAIFLNSFRQKHRTQYRLVFICFVIGLIYTYSYFSLTGSRNSIFVLLLNLAVIYSIYYGMNKKILLKGIVFALALLALFSYLGYERKSVLGYDNLAEKSYSSMLVEGINGAYGNDENLLWLIENNFEDVRLGSTYMAGPLNFVPRKLWSNKPVGGGPILVNEIYPGSYAVGQEGVSSLTTGLVTESFMNYGWTAAVILPFFLSFIFGMLKIYMRQVNTISSLVLGVYVTVSLSISIVQAEFLGLFTRTFFVGVGFTMVIFLTRLFNIKQRVS